MRHTQLLPLLGLPLLICWCRVQWRNKFIKHRDMGEQKNLEIPFPFYRDSITLFQARALCWVGGESSEGAWMGCGAGRVG